MLLSAALLAAALAAAAVHEEPQATSQPTTRPTSRPAGDPCGGRQRDIYFPPERFKDIRQIDVDGVRLLTDTRAPGLVVLRRHVAATVACLRKLPVLEPTSRRAGGPAATSSAAIRPAEAPIVAALYARQSEFRDLWYRVGLWYGGRFLGLTEAGGYSYRVFCATYANPKAPDAVPSELGHEIAHVWLWRRTGLPNDGNWLSEALAATVQSRLLPHAADRRAWAARVRAGRYLPLKRLLNTRPLPPERYWQAQSLAETLLARYPGALPAVISGLAADRSAHQIVTEALGVDWLTLEKQWAEHVLAGASGGR